MKKYILYSFLMASLIFTSCNDNETESLFSESINDRTQNLKTTYSTSLTAPADGWIGYYTPKGSLGTNVLLLNFDKQGNVVMKSDWNNGADDATITYRIDKGLKLELVFETRSVLHAIFEVNDNDNEGEYVFNILEATNDKVTLQSKSDNGYNGEDITILELVPAKASDWDLAPVLAMHQNVAGDPLASVFRNLIVSGDAASLFSYDNNSKVATFNYTEGTENKTTSIPVSVTSTGFCLLKEITLNGKTLKCFTWNTTDLKFEDTANEAELSYSPIPLSTLPFYNFSLADDDIRILRSNPGFVTRDLSSAGFINFYDSWANDFLAATGVGIRNFYIRNLDGKDFGGGSKPYFHIYLSNGDRAWLDIDFEIVDSALGNKVVKLSSTFASGNLQGIAFANYKPIFDFFLEASGFYIKNGPTLGNETFTLISVADSSKEVHFYDF